MKNVTNILQIDLSSFRVNIYTKHPFRMIGLIDVNMQFYYGIEKVTLAFYRSSGTNDGKIKGLWYPIAGLKVKDGPFTEFSDYINFVLTNTTRNSVASKGWLSKSVFFGVQDDKSMLPGFSNGVHYYKLLEIGETLRDLYESDDYSFDESLDSYSLNRVLALKEVYPGNNHTQRENFEKFIEDIFLEYRYE